MWVFTVIAWVTIELTIAVIGKEIPSDKFDYNNFWYSCFSFEKEGKFYERVFRIKSWKKYLPDGASVWKNGFTKRHLMSTEPEYMEKFIRETCKGETIHFIQIVFFWVVGFWTPMYMVFVMLFFALLTNIPCIIAQRYNRPRLLKVYRRQLRQIEQQNQPEEGGNEILNVQ
jgi:glycosyl-4,4'-diaponeurosporenoate acyltransferase